MLELILCSLVTVLPDYLFRRYREGKRWGDQITFFTMWYELRWGITACLILTVSFITVVFYYHPSTTNAGPTSARFRSYPRAVVAWRKSLSATVKPSRQGILCLACSTAPRLPA